MPCQLADTTMQRQLAYLTHGRNKTSHGSPPLSRCRIIPLPMAWGVLQPLHNTSKCNRSYNVGVDMLPKTASAYNHT